MSRGASTRIDPRVTFARRLHGLMTWAERWSILLLVLLAAATLVLAHQALEDRPGSAPASLVRRMYESVQLLKFDWDPRSAESSRWSWAARGTALATALVGTVEIVRRLFDLVLQRLLIRAFYAGHVVVCELDAAGAALCRGLIDSGCAVVAVAREETPTVARVRRWGVLVQRGDPLDPETLEAVGVDSAAWVAALHGGSPLAAAARESAGSGRTHALLCLIAHPTETVEPHPMLLSQHRLSRDALSVVQVNALDRAASYLVADAGVFTHVLGHRTLDDLRRARLRPRRVLVAGDGEMGARLAAVLAWDAAVVFAPVAGRAVLELALAHPRSAEVVDCLRRSLRSRLPEEAEVPALGAFDFAHPLESSVLGAGFLLREGKDPEAHFDLVFVCCATDDRTLATAEAVARRFSEHHQVSHPLVIAVLEEPSALEGHAFEPGTLEVPQDSGTGVGGERKLLYVYEAWQRTLTAERLLGMSPASGDHWGTEGFERLAKRVHRAYRDQERERAGQPRLAPHELEAEWKALSPDLCESNRQFVRDIDRKLALVGCSRVVAEGRAEAGARFTEVEIECLARAEHERWLVERWERGWAKAMTRDAARKLSSNLKPWHELDEPTREIDRQLVRRLEADVLNPEGFRIVRGRRTTVGLAGDGAPC